MACRSFITDAGYQMMMRNYLRTAAGANVVVLEFVFFINKSDYLVPSQMAGCVTCQWHNYGYHSFRNLKDPILVSMCIWGETFRSKKYRFSCDNEAERVMRLVVVLSLNTATSRSESRCIVRKLTLNCLELNIIIRASHTTSQESAD